MLSVVFARVLASRPTLAAIILLAVLLVMAGCSHSTQTARIPQADALLRAAREGNADTVRALLSTPGADVDATDERGSTALLEAARYGHDDVVRALLAAGANIKARDQNGKTALMLAVAAVTIQSCVETGGSPRITYRRKVKSRTCNFEQEHTAFVRRKREGSRRTG